LWLGFKQSISRYDGYHFTHFPQSEMLFGLSSDHKGKSGLPTSMDFLALTKKA
jgi:hypothetical protein